MIGVPMKLPTLDGIVRRGLPEIDSMIAWTGDRAHATYGACMLVHGWHACVGGQEWNTSWARMCSSYIIMYIHARTYDCACVTAWACMYPLLFLHVCMYVSVKMWIGSWMVFSYWD